MKQLIIAALASMVLVLPAYAAEKQVTSPTNIELADQATAPTAAPADASDATLKKAEGKETTKAN